MDERRLTQRVKMKRELTASISKWCD